MLVNQEIGLDHRYKRQGIDPVRIINPISTNVSFAVKKWNGFLITCGRTITCSNVARNGLARRKITYSMSVVAGESPFQSVGNKDTVAKSSANNVVKRFKMWVNIFFRITIMPSVARNGSKKRKTIPLRNAHAPKNRFQCVKNKDIDARNGWPMNQFCLPIKKKKKIKTKPMVIFWLSSAPFTVPREFRMQPSDNV